jgi:putative hydrolase of the HAD superfamily
LVILDVFNTLVRPRLGRRRTFHQGLKSCGVAPSWELIAALNRSSHGLAHHEWSASRRDYVGWCTETLKRVARSGCGGPDDHDPHVIPALEQLHPAPMRAYPDVRSCLLQLRRRGILVAVCSNWSWDLEADLHAAGIADLIDVFVTSAQVGARKPHAAVYRHVLTLAGVPADRALFVGDTYEADVLGPTAAGIAALHLVRSRGRRHPGVATITGLHELLSAG